MKFHGASFEIPKLKLKDLSVIARDLKSLEAISLGIGSAFHHAFYYRFNTADCFARACTESIEVFAMTSPPKPPSELQMIH